MALSCRRAVRVQRHLDKKKKRVRERAHAGSSVDPDALFLAASLRRIAFAFWGETWRDLGRAKGDEDVWMKRGREEKQRREELLSLFRRVNGVHWSLGVFSTSHAVGSEANPRRLFFLSVLRQ